VTAARVIAEVASVGVPEPEVFRCPTAELRSSGAPVRLSELEVEPGGRAIVFVCDDAATGWQIDGELLRDRSLLLCSRLRGSPPTYDLTRIPRADRG